MQMTRPSSFYPHRGKNKITCVLQVQNLVVVLLCELVVVAGGFVREKEAWQMLCAKADETSLLKPEVCNTGAGWVEVSRWRALRTLPRPVVLL